MTFPPTDHPEIISNEGDNPHAIQRGHHHPNKFARRVVRELRADLIDYDAPLPPDDEDDPLYVHTLLRDEGSAVELYSRHVHHDYAAVCPVHHGGDPWCYEGPDAAEYLQAAHDDLVHDGYDLGEHTVEGPFPVTLLSLEDVMDETVKEHTA